MGLNNYPLPKRTKTNVANCKSLLVRALDQKVEIEARSARQQARGQRTLVTTSIPDQGPSHLASLTLTGPTPALINSFPTLSQSQSTTYPGTLAMSAPSQQNPAYNSDNFGAFAHDMGQFPDYNNNQSRVSQDMASEWHPQDYAAPDPLPPETPQSWAIMTLRTGYRHDGFKWSPDRDRSHNSISQQFFEQAIRHLNLVEYDQHGRPYITASLYLGIEGCAFISPYVRFDILLMNGVDVLIGSHLYTTMFGDI